MSKHEQKRGQSTNWRWSSVVPHDNALQTHQLTGL